MRIRCLVSQCAACLLTCSLHCPACRSLVVCVVLWLAPLQASAVLLAELIPIETPTDPAAPDGRNSSLALDMEVDLAGPNVLGLRYFWSASQVGGILNSTAAARGAATSFLALLSCEDPAADFLPASSVVWFRLPASGVLECMGRLLLVAVVQISVAVVNDCFARRTNAVVSIDVSAASAKNTAFAGADALTDLSDTQAATKRLSTDPPGAAARDSETNPTATATATAAVDAAAEHGAQETPTRHALVAATISALPPSPALTPEDTAFYMKLFWERHFACIVCVSMLTVWWTLHYFYMAQLWKLVTCINGTPDT